jgi:glycosyltransferase involved in cell wall biosynthesis
VLLPCRDESATVAGCVLAARTFLDRRGVDGEVLVVDNGSADASAELALSAGARVVRIDEPGYGSALNGGIAEARGRFTIMADADGSYDLSDLGRVLDALLAGDELVVGDRFAGGIEPGAMPWLHRRIGNPLLSWLGRRLFGVRLRDMHCGLRGFVTERVRDLELRSTGMEWASEVIITAASRGLRIGEVPVPLRPDGRDGPSHLRTWSDGWRHLRLMLLLSPRWLFLHPGAALFWIGLTATVVLSITPVRIGRFGFDVATLLYAAALTMLGHALLWFAAVSERFAGRIGLGAATGRPHPWWPGWRLERGLAVGATLLVAGTGLALVSLLRWRAAGFAAVDPTTTVRIVVPAVLGLVLGVQTIFASLLLSVMDLPTSASAPGRSEHRRLRSIRGRAA